MTPITPEQLAEWKGLAERATEGPWQAWRMGNAPLLDGTLVGQSALRPVPRPYNPRWVGYQNEASALQHHHSTILTDEDADFIAAARSAVPSLIAEVERLRDFARSAVVAFDLAADLMPDNVINFAQFAIDARSALPEEPANG